MPTLSDPANLKLISLDEVFVLGNISPRMPARAISILVSGGVVSSTLILNAAVPILPALSVPLQETLVFPMGNIDPESGPQRTSIVPSTRSDPITLYMITLPDELVASTTESAGTLNKGGVLSVEFEEPL